ncbi:MAG TPA: DUF5329 domain-containing protein [Rhodocyclaceae bacterium]|nr:DUF5329 domain-containing protein [Rhodocyclaceae bacterium]
MRFVFAAIALLTIALSSPLRAEPSAEAVRAEIHSLLDRLESSGCQFNRNGTWHTAPEAKAHLLTKLDYLDKRATVQSTEQFIDLAASKSSLSGTPYQVRCGNTAPVESKLWLTKELQAVRSPGKTKLSGAR